MTASLRGGERRRKRPPRRPLSSSSSSSSAAAASLPSSSVFQKKLSSLSSTPFPAAAVALKRPHYNATSSFSWPEPEFDGGANDGDFHDDDDEDDDEEGDDDDIRRLLRPLRQSPLPDMPSPLFASLAQSQFELLSNSLVHAAAAAAVDDDETDEESSSSSSSSSNNNNNNNCNIKPGTPKISSMALYLPMENANTGQLEFVPAATYPDPSSDRVFIASGVGTGENGVGGSGGGGNTARPSMRSAPMGLPGYFGARDVMPSYPFVSSASPELLLSSDDENNNGEGMFETTVSSSSSDGAVSVGAVDEIPASPVDHHRGGGGGGGPSSLSVTLFSGLDTLGVLTVWPYRGAANDDDDDDDQRRWEWTSGDKLQVSRAARSLALALSMDNERASTRIANERFRVAMADGLHQVKSPLQALRTFGKLLQRKLAEENKNNANGGGIGGGGRNNSDRVPVPATTPAGGGGARQAIRLAEDMLSQGERVVDLIGPMDALVHEGDWGGRLLLSGDVAGEDPKSKSTTTSSSSSSSSALVLQPSRVAVDEDVVGGRRSSSHAIAGGEMIGLRYRLPPSMPVLGDFELEMAYPQDVLGSIVYASQAVSRERGINFDAVGFEPDNADLPGVTVCPRHLKEAASNVLDNAIKYVSRRRRGKKGRPRIPHIRVTLASNEPPLSPGCTLFVEDNGPGIPERERNKAFERGYRGEDVKEGVAGSGLGLAIARETITRMGGMIDLVEGPNGMDGTAVRVILFREPEL